MTPSLKTETANLPILVSALHKSVTYLLTYLDTYLQRRIHVGQRARELSHLNVTPAFYVT